MLDTFTWLSIVMRLIAVTMFVIVLHKQVKLYTPVSQVQWVKVILMVLVFVMLANSSLALLVNFFRQPDGNLVPQVRRISLIFNASAGLASALALVVLYFRKDNKE